MFKSSQQLANLLDYTLLNPTVNEKEIQKACQSAIHHQFAALCVPLALLEVAQGYLVNTSVRLSTVIGFPLGHTSIPVKIVEAMEAVKHGAQELEIMINLGFFKSGDDRYTIEEIRNIQNVAPQCIHKIIIETGLLNQEEKKRACGLILQTKASFVKTSTGMVSPGATPEDVRLLKKEVGKKAEVKASGGIRTLQSVLELWRAGARRIGTSSAVRIMEEYNNQTVSRKTRSKAS